MDNIDHANIVKKLERLSEFIRNFSGKGVIVAFSGGVDSSTLAALCSKELDKVIAVTAISPVSPKREIKEAERIAKEIGIHHTFINVNELEDPDFVKNTPDRCYYCKTNLIKSLLNFGKERGYSVIFEGTNVDELKGHRPGYKAVKGFENVFSPWAEFGFTKEEIRRIAKKMGLSFYNKPPLACLASRIPFGIKIDERKLRMVDEAENTILKIVQVNQIRVRNLNNVAVIEVEKDEIKKFFDEKIVNEIVERLKEIGFKQVLLDLEGYVSGKLSSLTM
ncbi:ATP-dependent sacrificial sulfur transferase LarE [Archaeoglobales archaeon]|nr:MAG: ATP-dependent sacrificial sulfur transferase LarE [Archaeoglobales archaeon]